MPQGPQYQYATTAWVNSLLPDNVPSGFANGHDLATCRWVWRRLQLAALNPDGSDEATLAAEGWALDGQYATVGWVEALLVRLPPAEGSAFIEPRVGSGLLTLNQGYLVQMDFSDGDDPPHNLVYAAIPQSRTGFARSTRVSPGHWSTFDPDIARNVVDYVILHEWDGAGSFLVVSEEGGALWHFGLDPVYLYKSDGIFMLVSNQGTLHIRGFTNPAGEPDSEFGITDNGRFWNFESFPVLGAVGVAGNDSRMVFVWRTESTGVLSGTIAEGTATGVSYIETVSGDSVEVTSAGYRVTFSGDNVVDVPRFAGT